MLNVRKELLYTVRAIEGFEVAKWKLVVSGLQPGDNDIPHDLPAAPFGLRSVTVRPQSGGGWHEFKEADRNYIYLHVEPGGPSLFVVEAETRHGS